jgi:hypothetical protein
MTAAPRQMPASKLRAVLSSSNRGEVLDTTNGALDDIARPIFVPIERVVVDSIDFVRDHHQRAARSQEGARVIGVQVLSAMSSLDYYGVSI